MHFSGSTLIWKIELICYNLSGGQQSYKRKNLRKTQYDSPEDSKVTLQVSKPFQAEQSYNGKLLSQVLEPIFCLQEALRMC